MNIIHLLALEIPLPGAAGDISKMQGIQEECPNPICFFFLIQTIFQQNA
jgi:hypothetical protein